MFEYLQPESKEIPFIFRITRVYWSTKNPKTKCRYMCEIQSKGVKQEEKQKDEEKKPDIESLTYCHNKEDWNTLLEKTECLCDLKKLESGSVKRKLYPEQCEECLRNRKYVFNPNHKEVSKIVNGLLKALKRQQKEQNHRKKTAPKKQKPKKAVSKKKESSKILSTGVISKNVEVVASQEKEQLQKSSPIQKSTSVVPSQASSTVVGTSNTIPSTSVSFATTSPSNVQVSQNALSIPPSAAVFSTYQPTQTTLSICPTSSQQHHLKAGNTSHVITQSDKVNNNFKKPFHTSPRKKFINSSTPDFHIEESTIHKLSSSVENITHQERATFASLPIANKVSIYPNQIIASKSSSVKLIQQPQASNSLAQYNMVPSHMISLPNGIAPVPNYTFITPKLSPVKVIPVSPVKNNVNHNKVNPLKILSQSGETSPPRKAHQLIMPKPTFNQVPSQPNFQNVLKPVNVLMPVQPEMETAAPQKPAKDFKKELLLIQVKEYLRKHPDAVKYSTVPPPDQTPVIHLSNGPVNPQNQLAFRAMLPEHLWNDLINAGIAKHEIEKIVIDSTKARQPNLPTSRVEMNESINNINSLNSSIKALQQIKMNILAQTQQNQTQHQQATHSAPQNFNKTEIVPKNYQHLHPTSHLPNQLPSNSQQQIVSTQVTSQQIIPSMFRPEQPLAPHQHDPTQQPQSLVFHQYQPPPARSKQKSCFTKAPPKKSVIHPQSNQNIYSTQILDPLLSQQLTETVNQLIQPNSNQAVSQMVSTNTTSQLSNQGKLLYNTHAVHQQNIPEGLHHLHHKAKMERSAFSQSRPVKPQPPKQKKHSSLIVPRDVDTAPSVTEPSSKKFIQTLYNNLVSHSALAQGTSVVTLPTNLKNKLSILPNPTAPNNYITIDSNLYSQKMQSYFPGSVPATKALHTKTPGNTNRMFTSNAQMNSSPVSILSNSLPQTALPTTVHSFSPSPKKKNKRIKLPSHSEDEASPKKMPSVSHKPTSTKPTKPSNKSSKQSVEKQQQVYETCLGNEIDLNIVGDEFVENQVEGEDDYADEVVMDEKKSKTGQLYFFILFVVISSTISCRLVFRA